MSSEHLRLTVSSAERAAACSITPPGARMIGCFRVRDGGGSAVFSGEGAV